MTLTSSQAKKFYDRFGKKQDAQAFYEDAALNDLIAHAHFESASSVFELGCGTGRFAARLLEQHLSPSALYEGVDVSTTMIDIARDRLAPFAPRAKVSLSDGAMTIPLADHSIDRFVSTYVLDLLSEQQIHQVIKEACRVLTKDGKLCLVSLTGGNTVISRTISGLWSMVFQLSASLVGGCRPVRLESFVDQTLWSIEHQHVASQFGIPSEVLVACPKISQKSQ